MVLPLGAVVVLFVRSYGGRYSSRDRIQGQSAHGAWTLVSAYGDLRWQYFPAAPPNPMGARWVSAVSEVRLPFPGVIWSDEIEIFGAPGAAPASRLVERTVIVSDALLACLALLLPLSALVRLAARRRLRGRRARAGLCPQCGYDLTGNSSGQCSECGEAIRGSRPHPGS